MNYWIFQAKTDRYDLSDPEILSEGKEEAWLATRYRIYMEPGDLVYLWLAGPPQIRGIYGWGRLISEPYPTEIGYRVKVAYDKRLAQHLMADEIFSHNSLNGLLIRKLAIGTNFRISQSQAQAIGMLLPESDRPQQAGAAKDTAGAS